MTEESLKNRIQLAASAIAVIGVVVYGIGFLVLTVHHASFGIPLIGFLRPRIISAGILFCAFATIPVAGLLFAVKRTKPATKKDIRDYLSVFVDFLLEALVISVAPLRVIFGGLPEQNLSHYYGWALAAVIVPVAVWTLPWWNRWGRILHVIGFVGIYTWVAFCLYKAHDKTFALLVIWFFVCGYTAYAVYDVFRNPDTTISIQRSVQSVVTCLGTVAFFALWLYPALPSSYLGGVPVPITFQFAEKSMPVANSAQLKGWLLDETEDGFYFIQDKNSKKAVFIPRSDVTAVYYGEQK